MLAQGVHCQACRKKIQPERFRCIVMARADELAPLDPKECATALSQDVVPHGQSRAAAVVRALEVGTIAAADLLRWAEADAGPVAALMKQPQPRGHTVRGRFPTPTRYAIVLRDRGICRLCGGRGAVECDHIRPAHHGGSHVQENGRVLCRRCNRRRSSEPEAAGDLLPPRTRFRGRVCEWYVRSIGAANLRLIEIDGTCSVVTRSDLQHPLDYTKAVAAWIRAGRPALASTCPLESSQR